MGDPVFQISDGEQIFFGIGRPPPAEVRSFVFEPLDVQSPEEPLSPRGEDPGPVRYIAVRYPTPVGMKEHRLEYRPGLSAKHYLREARLIGMRMRMSLRNGRNQRVRLNYVPSECETISLVSR